jgi:hypothetical protein
MKQFFLLALAALCVYGPLGADDKISVRPDDVANRVAEFRKGAKAGWSKIPWVGSLAEARQHAKAENAYIFLFTLDGNLAAGRC